MQEKVKKFLNRPFPLFLSYPWGKIYYVLMIFLFILLVNVLQPFGLSNWHEFHKGLVLSGYIVVCFGIYALVHLILYCLRSHHFCRENWTLKKEFHVLILYLPVIAFISWIFTLVSVQEFELNLNSFLQLQYYNSILGIIAVPSFGFFVGNKLKPTGNIEEKEMLPVISAPDEIPQPKEDIIPIKKLELDFKKVLYVECRHNDLHISYLNSGKMATLIQRCSLKELESLLSDYPQLKRCHKSFMVNITQVQNWSGNMEKMTLYLKHCNQTVTVSRTCTHQIKEILIANSIQKISTLM